MRAAGVFTWRRVIEIFGKPFKIMEENISRKGGHTNPPNAGAVLFWSFSGFIWARSGNFYRPGQIKPK
jgi:hypothetical protein